jgi:methionyl-tRNA formyltransferase
LEQLRRGAGVKIPQPETGITYAPPITREMRLLRWEQTALEVAGWIRGLDPKPGAYTLWKGQRLRLFGARVEKPSGSASTPGTALGLVQDRLEVACGQGSVSLKELQLAGHKRLSAKAFLRGQPLIGQVLG